MDCFFAACELLKDPSLKGKPVIIGGPKDSIRGVVSTANYEARAFGVHSAMPTALAAKKCPNGIFLNGDMQLYRAESKRIMHILSQFSPIFNQASVDEAYLDVTHLVESKDDWLKIARRIRASIYHKTGYTCSVGIGTCTTVAKIASGHQKPSGITVVHNAKEFLAPLPISSMPGIGKKSVPRYHSKRIRTIGDFAKRDIFEIISSFGKHSIKHHQIANGTYFNQITMSDIDKSISSETTFTTDVTDKTQILQMMQKLALKVYNRLQDYEFKTVSIKIRFSDFHTITRSFTFSQHGKSLANIIIAIQELYIENVEHIDAIRLVGVKLEQLSRIEGLQQTLSFYAT